MIKGFITQNMLHGWGFPDHLSGQTGTSHYYNQNSLDLDIKKILHFHDFKKSFIQKINYTKV